MITTNCNIKERRRKEALPFSLSLSLQGLQASFAYYGYAQRVLKNHGPKYSQVPGKKRLYLSLYPSPYGRRLFNFFFLRKHQLFLGFSSLPLFHFRANTLCTSFNFSLFQLFLHNYFFSAHTNGGTSTYNLHRPFLNWYPRKTPTIRSHPDQTSRKSCA